jgi:putative spermidine/putrescine transport system permease protein
VTPTAPTRVAVHALAGVTLAFLVLPIVAVVPASLNPLSHLRIPPPGVSTRWYREFFRDPEWLTALGTSVRVALLTTALALVLGILAALGLERLGGRLRQLFTALVLAPLIVPVMVTSVALYYVGQRAGLVGTSLGMAIGHTLMALPFVVLNVGVSLQGLDPMLPRAAHGLGASAWHAFRTVTLPLILPGLIGGAVFAFITSFDEVVLSIFLAGVGAKTLPVKMWEVIRVEITPVAAVASTLFVALTLVLFAVVRRAGPRAEAAEGAASR